MTDDDLDAALDRLPQYPASTVNGPKIQADALDLVPTRQKRR